VKRRARSLAIAQHAQDHIVMEYGCRFIARHAYRPDASKRGVSSAHNTAIARCQSGIRLPLQYVVLIMYFQTIPTKRNIRKRAE